ncbi:MAG: hypothetical protein E6H09_18775 [Bacteroidetes bacterium]|nr:MAG: hypothetical protein E6H09_18775 [Bacteroidota bacterium]
MKKYILSIILAGFASSAFTQKNYLDKVTDSTCKCLEAGKAKVKSEADLDKLGENCILKAATPYLDSFSRDENVKIEDLDGEIGNKIGQKIGMKLVTNCPAFVELIATFSNSQDEPEVVTGKTSGTVTAVTTSDHIFLSIKEASGKITRLAWIEYFPGADEYKSNPALLKGKQVEVEWKQSEIYNIANKDFAIVKVISKLRVK